MDTKVLTDPARNPKIRSASAAGGRMACFADSVLDYSINRPSTHLALFLRRLTHRCFLARQVHQRVTGRIPLV